MNFLFLLEFFFLISAISAQHHLMPGSINGGLVNGRGGLGRFFRHLEHHDDTSYYANGNGFGGLRSVYYVAPVYGFYG